MKICTKCKINKNLSEFFKNKSRKDGYSYHCKSCAIKMTENYRKTKIGVINTIYNSQVASSKDRKHKPPTYTKQELLDWLLNDWLFGLLYQNWVNCGYQREMKPSIDRLDDSKGYSFDNVQITTWGENKAKGHSDTRSGKITHGNKPQKAVYQYTLNGVFVADFVSIMEAERQTGITNQSISECCNNIYKSTSGFTWIFK